MSRPEPRIISDSTKAPVSSQLGDWQDLVGHHRYYGSSALYGERITKTRRGPCPRLVNVCGF